MGAAISVTAANLTMEALEARALASFAPQPKVFLRYVDDCFCVVQKDAANSLLAHLNSMERAIQFTSEEGADGKLPFLDVLVSRQGQRLRFSVYRKETHTDRYLNFNSVHPASRKTAVVSTLLQRAKRLCSKPEDAAVDTAKVRDDLASCGYPRHFINATERQLTRRGQLDVPPAPMKRAPVPYLPGTSECLARILREYDVQVAHVPAKKMRHELVRVKDRLPKERFPGVVYEIPCADCSGVYIGESGNYKNRLQQYARDVKNKSVRNNALAEHAVVNDHKIDWDNARIVATEKVTASRLHLESLIIQTTSNTVNRNDGNLNPIYARSLQRLFKPT